MYSDLSFITLMYVVGKVASLKVLRTLEMAPCLTFHSLLYSQGLVREADFLPSCTGCDHEGCRLQCAYEAFVRKHVLRPLGMRRSRFLPEDPQYISDCIPTTVPSGENITNNLQGRVEDGNAYILGGISGHAGLFSTARDLSRLLSSLLFAAGSVEFLNKSTVATFTKQVNHTQSSRALGWNTNDITAQPDGGALPPLTTP